jgi:hypothetical protein
MQVLFHLLEFLAEDFRCHVHHFQCLVVPAELAAMRFVFRFMVWSEQQRCWCVWLCQRVYEFFNVIDHLVCWLGIVYNICISHIFRRCLVWGDLVAYVKFLGLFQLWYTYDECWIYEKFDFISGCVNISCFERSTCLTNMEFGTFCCPLSHGLRPKRL